MRMGFGLALLAGTITMATAAAGGQVSAYADLSASKLTNPGETDIFFGPTIGVSITLKSAKRVIFAGDIRGQFLGGAKRLDEVTFGPKVSFPVRGFEPYVEGATGFGRFNTGAGVAGSASTDTEWQAIGGVDRAVRGNFDVRLFEFSYQQYYGMQQTFSPLTFSTGIVYHLGGRGRS